MNVLASLLKKEITRIYNSIQNDECEMTEEQAEMILQALTHVPISKDQVCNEVLHWS